ncbi:hypothetical protein F383_16877 [Gossypium arboreum]|uniref:Uncharacterized protein n=1 Tax=Gossypium arboreum TaxID=29729 RepID=A0A0B0NMG4_GOSAR|nr:hypothetical protein F383_16877 [Gossypium arboreum]
MPLSQTRFYTTHISMPMA